MLETVLTLSLFCFGVQLSTEYGMIFHPLRRFIIILLAGNIDGTGEPIFTNKLQEYLYKPLMGCLPCMASVWGGSAYLIFFGGIEVIYYIPAIAACNFLLTRVQLFLEK